MTALIASAVSVAAARVSAPAWLGREGSGREAFAESRGVCVRRQQGTERWLQPALDAVLVVVNRGDPVDVTLCAAGRSQRQTLDRGDLIVIPAGQANSWAFDGPTELGWLSLAPTVVKRAGAGAPGRRIGLRDPYLSGLVEALGDALVAAGSANRLYLDSLAIVLARALPAEPPPLRPIGPAKGGLPGWKLKRVLEHLDLHLGEAVAIEDLMAVAGLSRAQLFRAFKASTGETPLAFVSRLRRERGLPAR